ncbi:MAG: hypothetical protein HFG80_06920 [Eubacterium sp.]|jgi:hypothetical protein|nr:hypothetical protein [Eubacterium sp.]
MESTVELETRIQRLEKENQYLKKLLAVAGISYSAKETNRCIQQTYHKEID